MFCFKYLNMSRLPDWSFTAPSLSSTALDYLVKLQVYNLLSRTIFNDTSSHIVTTVEYIFHVTSNTS
jgi:hypothetical protein